MRLILCALALTGMALVPAAGADPPADGSDTALLLGAEPGDVVAEPPAIDPTQRRDVTLRIAVQLNGQAVDTGAIGQITGTNERWHTMRDQASRPWWEFRLRGVTGDAFQFDMTATYYVQLIGRVHAEYAGTASITIPVGGNYGPAAVPPDVTINLRFVGFRIIQPPLP